jgi:hypothetical protein
MLSLSQRHFTAYVVPFPAIIRLTSSTSRPIRENRHGWTSCFYQHGRHTFGRGFCCTNRSRLETPGLLSSKFPPVLSSAYDVVAASRLNQSLNDTELMLSDSALLRLMLADSFILTWGRMLTRIRLPITPDFSSVPIRRADMRLRTMYAKRVATERAVRLEADTSDRYGVVSMQPFAKLSFSSILA